MKYTQYLAIGLLAAGCTEIHPSYDERAMPAAPLTLAISGIGVFQGRAEYEVSEPLASYLPRTELVLYGDTYGPGDGPSHAALRLEQKVRGDFIHYYTTIGNEFTIDLGGGQYLDGQIMEARIDLGDGMSGTFRLAVDGGDQVLDGWFSTGKVYLNCNRLVGDGPVWAPDEKLESEFCSKMNRLIGQSVRNLDTENERNR